jgi:hypothetical protein
VLSSGRVITQLAEAPADEKLSDSLRRLLRAADGRAMRVRDMIDILQGRGMQMIVVLLCLPFLSPVSIPGISIPFGLAIALCGLRIACGHRPWLPGLILDRHVPHAALEKMIGVGCSIHQRIEKVIRPRFSLIFSAPGMGTLLGLAMAIGGLLLSLPIPPPFILTNTIPGVAVILLSLGLMERDGVLVLIGYGMVVVGTLYVALIFFLGKEAVEYLTKLL